jgi:hypothetical protein
MAALADQPPAVLYEALAIQPTPAGVEAIRRVTADGINVNVTLLFSLDAHAAVMAAYVARPRGAHAPGPARRPRRVGGELLRLARRHCGRPAAC